MSRPLLDALENVITRQKKCMAIIDFGGTLSHGWLTSAILYYQIEHMKFAFTPDQFHEVFYFSTEDTKHCFDRDLLAVDHKGKAIPSTNFYATLHGYYKELYDWKHVSSLQDIRTTTTFQQFKLLMLFYHQQFTRMMKENEGCRKLGRYQVSRWWLYMPMESVKTLAYEMGQYKAEIVENVKVEGKATIKKQKVSVKYVFDFTLFEAPVELIRILNDYGIYTLILTGAEHTMVSHYNEKAIHATSAYAVQYTHNAPKEMAHDSLHTATFAGFVEPATTPPILEGKSQIIHQIMDIKRLEPCIVLADSASDYGMVEPMKEGIVIAVQSAGHFPFHDLVIERHPEAKGGRGPVHVFKQYIKDGNWVSYVNHEDPSTSSLMFKPEYPGFKVR
ncbi:unnamed protein product [Albugo candida]|uniref:Uncharacterized protein n=1 Tax=Albugo candida TaxID=65357 RepID=A0A024GS72_9STRA|nr:unnamed protein product [Albugo candida]|eukprot:CCI49563.1 unnamed protein product [Albugo candida]